MKPQTGMLEIRPVYVRKESRTRGHVLVTMLAYMMAQSLQTAIAPLNLTTTAALDYVAQLQTVRLSMAHSTLPPVKKIQIPTPPAPQANIAYGNISLLNSAGSHARAYCPASPETPATKTQDVARRGKNLSTELYSHTPHEYSPT